MTEEEREYNFNHLVAAFREMDAPSKVKAGLLSTALKDIRWGAWDKYGITREALVQVNENRVLGQHDFIGCETAHEFPRAETTRKLVTENVPDPYQFMRRLSRCIVSTREENRANEGHAHFSRIYPLRPDLFTVSIRPSVKKRHPDYPAFTTLLESIKTGDIE